MAFHNADFLKTHNHPTRFCDRLLYSNSCKSDEKLFFFKILLHFKIYLFIYISTLTLKPSDGDECIQLGSRMFLNPSGTPSHHYNIFHGSEYLIKFHHLGSTLEQHCRIRWAYPRPQASKQPLWPASAWL